MVYTVTLNPSLDYMMFVDGFTTGDINKSTYDTISFGGKGINVSAVLKELSIENTALGFVAGFVGDQIEFLLKEAGIRTDFIKLSHGCSRINVKLTESQHETAVDAIGPEPTNLDIVNIYEKLHMLEENDILVLAGSIPPSLSEHVYEEILERVRDKGVLTVVDAQGKLLLNTLKYKPFLIKPNHIELGELFDKKLTKKDEIKKYATELRLMGARNVLVSMGEHGAVLVTEEDEVIEIGAAKGNVINTTGAGDSMVAGFLAGYIRKKDYEYALALGTAAGAATAFSDKTAKREEIYHVLNMIFW